jgi:hypothetical protein
MVLLSEPLKAAARSVSDALMKQILAVVNVLYTSGTHAWVLQCDGNRVEDGGARNPGVLDRWSRKRFDLQHNFPPLLTFYRHDMHASIGNSFVDDTE